MSEEVKGKQWPLASAEEYSRVLTPEELQDIRKENAAIKARVAELYEPVAPQEEQRDSRTVGVAGRPSPYYLSIKEKIEDARLSVPSPGQEEQQGELPHTCQTCRSWSYYEGEQYGTCKRAEEKGSLVRLDIYSMLATQPTFGCVQYEGRKADEVVS